MNLHLGSINVNLDSRTDVWLDVRAYGAIGDGATDDTSAIQNAINALTSSTGGTVLLPAGVYKVTDTITFPTVTAGYKKNIRIQGEGSGLAAGGTTFPLGTRIDYYGTGMLFDLYTGTPASYNVQFRDFEAYDRGGSNQTTGVKAYTFTTGSIIENVGFKNFYDSVNITNYAYYSKLDRVASFGARNIGIQIKDPNMMSIFRCQASTSTGTGLYINGSHGVMIRDGHYEGNGAYGIHVTSTGILRGVMIEGNYLEHNTDGEIYVTGTEANPCRGGHIAGNYTPFDTDYDKSLILGYVHGMMVTGNTWGTYTGDECVNSTLCEDCCFVSNYYNTGAATPLNVPAANTKIEPQISTMSLQSFE